MRIVIDTRVGDERARQLLWLVLSMSSAERRRIGLKATISAKRQLVCSDGVMFDDVPFRGAVTLDDTLDQNVINMDSTPASVVEVLGQRELDRFEGSRP